jgi:hypothetical protein
MNPRGAAARGVPWLVLLIAAVAGAQPSGPESPDVPAGPATVVGRLVHETRPDAVAEVDVLLYALSADGSAGLRQGRTDTLGRFRFAGVSNAPGIVYLVGARPGEIPFGHRFSFAANELEHRVELALSDPVTDTRHVAATALDIRVERGCTHLRVSHRHPIANRRDRVVFVPEEQRAAATPILEVELPAEADGFESLSGGEGLVRDGRRVRFWGPLYPGEQAIEFGYGLPMETAAFAIGFPHGAPPVQVLAPQRVVSLSASGLRAAPEVAIGDQRYAALRGDRIAAGGSLALAVALDAPVAVPTLRTPRAELWVELDDAALEVDERLEVVVDGHGDPLVSAAAPLLCIPLPAGTDALRFSSEMLNAGLRRDPSGDLAIHGPLPRGTSQVALSYQLPATSRGAELVRRFDRALPLLTVLVADNGVIADTARLHRRQAVRAGDRTYLHLEAFAVQPNEAIELGLRRTAPRASGGRWASAGFAVLAGLAALGFLLGPLRGGAQRGEAERRSDRSARDRREPAEASLERTAIVRSLDALDDDLETGKLSAEDHTAMRAELRSRAAALLLAKPTEAVSEPVPDTCGACGAAVRPADAFCSLCGAKLQVVRSA